MQEIKQIGEIDWTYDEMRAAIPEFLALYNRRPIKENNGGMKSPHMFATWFMLKKINPKNIVESGIWKGQGTWLIEQTLPDANIYSIDVNLSIRQYVSDHVQYFKNDFSKIDWSIIEDKENTLLFFDDHQNAFNRIKQGKELGFKQFIFEDNYPSTHGDCYSLKKAFQHAGFIPNFSNQSWKSKIKNLIKPRKVEKILPNSEDANYLKSTLDIYYEFPPVFKKQLTRWKEKWEDDVYPTPTALYQNVEQDYLKIFDEDADSYTWICYAQLK